MAPTLLELMHFAREVPVAEPVLRYAVRIVRRTNPGHARAPAEIKRFARYGSSPRGLQSLVLGAKVRGLLEGRFNVAFEDIRAVALAGAAPPRHPRLRSRRRRRDHRQADPRRRDHHARGIDAERWNPQTLLDGAFARRLERLTLVSRKRLVGQGQGDRRSLRKGSSLEFADYRHYVEGDDPARVDWNIYSRTDTLFVRLYEEEEVLNAHLLVDASRSMDWGSRPSCTSRAGWPPRSATSR